ncbi:enoyl-CoA hydratase/isomerase family protein [Sphingobacterium paludis]|uniref:Enoyl-CoA hydratase/carnithine racemase n=1 Tax=Sphingobacterium paludis TaxID=1476465 RepID=A0A4R7D773_9SPHI|nr:enoyl-CoA hydratase/isomerase family protein [Sphingobacterium paludis]TDS14846.1 enoyl-CoA hydratase/carnithine racemase [Sphingobacterium paludis]
MYNFIKAEKKDHIGVLTLARSAKRNAFTPGMINEIAHALNQFNADKDIRVLLLQAEGPVFSAGMDLKTFRDPSLDTPNPSIIHTDVSLGEVMDSFKKPIVAKVEGDVIAGAFLFVLGCTYVYASPQVRFRLPELELGIFPFQVMAGLLRVMPEKKVLQLCLNTEYFNVEEAIRYGIVDGILETDQLSDLLNSFSDKQEAALKAGIDALKQLSTVKREEQFAFLKDQLERLRDGKA